MTLDAIADVLADVPATIDAHLYLWTTQRFLWDTRTVAERAGYRPQQVLVWAKLPNGKDMGGVRADRRVLRLLPA
jgi:hypothetical protein